VRDPYVTVNDPERAQLLAMASQPVTFPLTDADRDCIAELGERLDEEGDAALGIAAVQIGYPKQMFVMRDDQGNNLFCLNPQITARSKETTKRMEGCLSIPEFGTNPIRPKSVTLKYMTPDGIVEERTFTGLASRVVCHEMDHLEGILLINHMEKKVARHAIAVEEKQRAKNKRVAKRRAKDKQARKQRRKQRG
jgi:peptide deformylase